MEYAAKNRASDVHIEPLEKELNILGSGLTVYLREINASA